jgi:hypothetical protein
MKRSKALYDALSVAGCGLFSYGAWLAWHPLGFLTGGVLLAGGSFFLGYAKPK